MCQKRTNERLYPEKLPMKKRQRGHFAAVSFEKREKREKRECVSRVRSDFCFLLLTGYILPRNYDQNIGMMFLNYEFDFEIVNIPVPLTSHEPLLHCLAVVVVGGEKVQLCGGNVPLGTVHCGLGLQELALG